MIRFFDPETVIQLTPLWKGERFADGRPKVPDRVLTALRTMTLEEVWKPIFMQGYESQFEGDLRVLQEDGRKLIGRAVTCSYSPTRPDLFQVMMEQGKREGRVGTFNQWVVDSLTDKDALVVDMYDKIYKGTFLGGNLTSMIKKKTGTGGAVVWGGIRDVEQMKKIDTQVYYRGIDPTPIREFCINAINQPTRIGKAIVLPGDVVFGAGGGVLFIPAHLAEAVVDGAAKTHVKDEFGFEKIAAGEWNSAQIDRPWTFDMVMELTKWIAQDPRGADYRSLDWTQELEASKRGITDPSATML